jgi:glycosyltransferase involved in cell wall biosynthesis
MKIAIIIPAYNEEMNIEKLLSELDNFSRKRVIVVDDGSVDGTTSVADKFGVILLKHKSNLGKGMAHRTAFKYAIVNGFDGVITMDADGQHAPEEIEYFARLGNSADIIVGTRKMSLANMPVLRYLTNKVTSLTVSLIASQRIKDSQSGFRYISSEVLKKIPLRTSRFQTESELLIKAGRMGFKISSVFISTIYSKEKSYINPIVDTLRFIGLAARSLFE